MKNKMLPKSALLGFLLGTIFIGFPQKTDAFDGKMPVGGPFLGLLPPSGVCSVKSITTDNYSGAALVAARTGTAGGFFGSGTLSGQANVPNSVSTDFASMSVSYFLLGFTDSYVSVTAGGEVFPAGSVVGSVADITGSLGTIYIKTYLGGVLQENVSSFSSTSYFSGHENRSFTATLPFDEIQFHISSDGLILGSMSANLYWMFVKYTDLSTSATATKPTTYGGSNGSIDLTVSGGKSAYSYSWSNGATTQDLSGLSAGNYIVTVTDANACTSSRTVTISNPNFPGGVTGATVWLRADAGTSTSTDGATVNTWTDQSGSANNASTTANSGWTNPGVNPPIYRAGTNTLGVNYNPSLDFSGGKSLDGAAGLSTRQLYVVYENGNTDNTFVIGFDDINGGGGSTQSGLVHRSGAADYFARNSTTNNYFYGYLFHTVPQTEPIVFDGQQITTTTGSLLVNGSGTTSFSNGGTPPTPFSGAFRLNKTSINTLPANVQISEVISYNSNLTTSDRQKVASYLALKYGITLAHNYYASDWNGTTGTTFWNLTTNAGQNNNIAGIGRDDLSGLSQKQSRSVKTASSGDLVAMGLGSMAADNAANTNTFTADKTFLVWGDNNGINAWQSAENPTNRQRLTREWRVQETGTVGTVTVRVQDNSASSGGKLPAEVGRVYLLVDNDSDFGNGIASEIPMTLTGDVWEATADFTNGQYFTFATPINLSPGGVSTPMLWLLANSGTSTTTDGSATTSWTSLAPGASVLTASAGQQPIYKLTSSNINFNPVLDFDGTDDRFAGTSNFGVTGTNSITAFTAFRRQDDASYDMFFGGNTTATNSLGYMVSPSGQSNRALVQANGVAGVLGSNTAPIAGQSMIKGFNRSASNTWTHYQNGLADGSSGSISGFGGSLANYNLNVGVGEGTQSPFNGDIAELIIHQLSLNAAEMNRVQSYLALKYGITLGSTTLPVNYTASDGSTIFWTGSTTYQNNVAGIGADYISGLEQKQSRSVNTASSGDLVTMGLGSIAANNIANTNAFSADLSFLMWGDDNGANNWQTTETHAALRKRLTREWKVQETGTVGNVVVRVQDDAATSGGELPAEIGAVYLLVDADGNFSSGATEYAMTLNGTNWEVNVDLTNGQYFTFATQTSVSPGGVSGAAIWLRPDVGVTTGATFTWADQSGNSRNAAQSTATNQPALNSNGANFNNAITFDGTNDYLSLSNLSGLPTGASQVEQFAVANNLNTSGGWQHIMNYGNTGIQESFGLSKNAGNGNAVAMGYFVDAISTASEFTGGLPVLLDGKYSGSQLVISSFGAQRATLATTLNLGTSVGYVGVDPIVASTTHWNGNISEIILFPTNLSTSNAQKVNSYLAIKYGITLDQTTPYNYLDSDGSTIWDATTNATWKNNITGIGRDDSGGSANSGLNQKQSKSVNTAALVTVGNGNTIATTNALNSNTFSADKSFLIFGDDNGSIAVWTTAESNNTSTRQRLAREWKVAETGTVGSVKIQVPDNSSSLTTELPAEITTVYLLVDADGNFSTGATEYAMTLNGSNWEANVDLSNGQFFTFATQIPPAPGGVVSNLTLWLKADAGTSTTTNNTSLATWTNQSGYPNATGGVSPLYMDNSADNVNFNPVVKFNGTTQYLDIASDLGMTSNVVSLFSTINIPTGSTGTRAILGATATVPTVAFYYDDGSFGSNPHNTGIDNNGFGNFVYSKDSLFEGKPNLVFARRNVSTSTIWINGTDQFGGQNWPVGSFASDNKRIGGTFWVGALYAPLRGNLPELIGYNSSVADYEALRIDAYLALKYGITLPHNYYASDWNGTSGTTFWNITTNAGYNSNITGIGRDDNSALSQKQSKSVNTAALVTVGNGNTIATTNALNSNTFSADKSFLVFGDDNGSIAAWTTAESNNTTRQRLAREWKVQETGTVGSVKIQVPDNSSSLTTELPAEITTVYLLVDADGNFSAGATEYAMTLNGSNWEANVDFTNGQYFTFATAIPNVPGCTSVPKNWFKAESGITTSGSTVTTWTNQVTNAGIPSVTGTTGNTYNSGDGISFLPSISFSGTTPPSLQSPTSAITDFISTSQGAVYGVITDATSGANNYAFGYGTLVGVTPGIEISMLRNGTVLDNTTGNGTGNAFLNNLGTFNSEPAVIGTNFTPNASPDDYAYFNGKQGTVGNSPADAYTNGRLFVGGVANGYGQQGFDGSVGEILSYDVTHTAAERNKIESYLASKWGITLDQSTNTNYTAGNGTVYWDATSNSTYKNRITVIGREDCSTLNKKQSKSVHSGNLVRMGLGSVAATNAANANTFSADNQFLAFGDDNGSTAVQGSNNPIGTCGRMTRILKVQETGGEVGTLGVQFDLSSLSSTYGSYSASGLKLLVSSSTSFSTVLRTYTASTYASGLATFANVDLDDGEFFTLGVFDGNTSVSSNSPVCEGESLELMANGGTTYAWVGPNGFYSSLRNPIIPSARLTDEGTYYVTISDAFGCSSVQSLSVVVQTCSPEVCAFDVCNNTTVSGSITATDADGDALTYTVTQNPANGTLTVVGNNFTYDPSNTFVGEDQFTIQACDPSGACVNCVKKLVVTSCGAEPVCGSSTLLTTCMGIPNSGTLNATDPSGGTITYSIVSQPSSGTISLVGNTYTYTPVQGFEGTVTWIYRATNANGSVDCSVSIYVENCYSTCEGDGCGSANLISGGTYSNSGANIFCRTGIAVSQNDYCFKASLTNNCASCPSSAAVYFTVNGIRIGTVYAGSLPLGVATTYGFSFSTSDIGSPGSVDVCLTHSGFGTPGTDIVVTSPELRSIGVPLPVANDDEVFLTSNSTPYLVAVLDNDIFVPSGAVPTILAAPTAGTGTATVSGDEILFTPNASFTGTSSFTYQVCNGVCCDDATVTLSITDCDITISHIDVSDCYLDGSVWKSDVAVVFYWKDAPLQDSLKVTVGSQVKYFYPTQYLTTSIASLDFTGITANGTTNVPVTVEFANLPSCAASSSFDLPNCPPACPANTISGTVWRDFDNDGAKDQNETTGISGVNVFIFNNLGNLLSNTTTDASGNYQFAGLTNASRYRVEFRNLPANFEPTPNGPDNGSALQFITVPDCDADFGANNPGDYCDENPSIGVPCYVNGDIGAAGVASMDAFVYFPYEAWSIYDGNIPGTTSTPPPSHVATAGQIGTTWGVAYRRQSQTLFTSAVVKRHCDLGPLGTGGIYKMDMTNPASPVISNWLDVQTLGINTGADPRDGTPGNTLPGSTTLPSFDLNAFDAVGKRGIGDLDFDEERNTLWFVNLNEQTLCGLENISATATPSAADVVGEYAITMPSGYACAGGATVHAWGLDVHDGLIYVGVVCTEEMSAPDTADLRGYVLSFNPDNPGAGFSYVAQFPLNYTKYSYGIFTYSNWVDSHTSNSGLSSPILSDIEIDDDGSLILGITDRLGMQRGHQNYLPDPTMTNTALFDYGQVGDILRICKIGNNYVLPGSDPGCPLLNASQGDGINGGEYYWGDWGPWFPVGSPSPDRGFNETAMGALAFLPGSGQVLSTQGDVVAFRSGGVVTFNNATGDADNRYQVYDEYNVGAQGKATGLGDLEIMCALPPLELGNYVWLDADQDGLQDASETALSGIVVELWKNGSKIAQNTTNASGEYYFSDKNAAGVTWTGTGADTALQINTAYEVRIQQSQAALSGRSLTARNATANNGNDQNDSDGQTGTSYYFIALTSGGLGWVDHSFDFGFIACPTPTVSISANVSSVCTGATATLTANVSGSAGDCNVQWQYLNGAVWTNISGADSTVYVVANLSVTTQYRATYGCGFCPVATSSPLTVSVSNQPQLWAIDEDEGAPGHLRLWSFGDYSNPTTTATDYGRIQYFDPSTSTIRDIGDAGDIEGMAVNKYTGQAYILSQRKTNNAANATQALFTYNLNEAAANNGNIIFKVLGHMTRPTTNISIEALAFDPLTNRLYGADPVGSGQNTDTQTDVLVYINLNSLNANPLLASSWTTVGAISGLGNTNNYVDGLEFSENGDLYAVDGTDEDLYRIDKNTGAILAIEDNNLEASLGLVDMETMAWDNLNNRLIAIDNLGHQFIELTTGSNGSNIVRGTFLPGTPGLPSDADFEGSAMYDGCDLLTVGNVVFNDANADGNFDSGEGVANVDVQLFLAGQNPLTDIPVAETATAADGTYLFQYLEENVSYFVHIPASEFQSGQPLFGYKSVPGNGGDVAIDDNLDENGIDNATPATNGISSTSINLLAGAEPTDAAGETGFSNTTDNSDDDNGNLTVDFGFCYNPLTVSISGTDSICVGGSVTFTSMVSGGTANFYQWQYSPDGVNAWSNINGANSPSVTAIGLTTDSYYRLLVGATGNTCTAASTNVAFVAVVPNATASIVGANITVCAGSSGTLTATITGGGAGTPTYQWQVSTDGSNFSDIPGATNSVYNTGALTQTRHYQVVINFTGSNCGAATSAVGTLIVVPDPTISVSGGSSVCFGGTATLNATTSGGTGTCILQWQRKIGSAWSNVFGANSSTYTPPALTTTTFFRAIYNCTGSDCDPAASDSVAIVVLAGVAIADQPDGAVICPGGMASLTTSTTGGTGSTSYQWQYFNGASWANVSANAPTGATYNGINSNSLTISSITNAGSYDYRALVNDSGTGCAQVASQTATLDVVQPSSAVASTDCSADLATYTVFLDMNNASITATSAGVANGTSVSDIPTGQNVAITVEESGCPLVLNVSAPVCACPTVNPPTGGTFSMCFGGTNPVLSATFSPGTTGDWYAAPSGGSVLGSGETFVPSGSLAVGTHTWYVEARDLTNACTSASRTAVTLTVNPLPTVSAGADASICPGESANLLATASGGTGEIAFAWSNGLGSGAAKTATPAAPATYTVTATDAAGCSATDVVGILLNPAPSFGIIVHSSCPGNIQGAGIIAYANIFPPSTEVSINGGLWQPYPSGGTLSGLIVGTNTISVRILGGCSTERTVVVQVSN